MQHTIDQFRQPNVLLTGSNGYLGSRIACRLKDCVVLTALTRSDVSLHDRAAISDIIEAVRPEHVIHAAGYTGADKLALQSDNLLATETIADALLDTLPQSSLTVLGSAAEYGTSLSTCMIAEDHPCNPVSDYGRIKLATTQALLRRADSRGLRVNVVRPFNPIDAPLSTRQVLGAFVEKACHARLVGETTITMGRMDAVRDFFAVADLLELVQHLVLEDLHGLIVNACSGVSNRVRDLVNFLNRLPGGGFRIEEDGHISAHDDVVIGDPSRMLSLIGRTSTRPIEAILIAAWQQSINR